MRKPTIYTNKQLRAMLPQDPITSDIIADLLAARQLIVELACAADTSFMPRWRVKARVSQADKYLVAAGVGEAR